MSNRPPRRPYPSVSADAESTEPLLGTPAQSKSTPTSPKSVLPSTTTATSRGSGQQSTVAYHTFQTPPLVSSRTKPKQPNRTTKTSQKLKLFPEDGDQALGVIPEDLENDVYTQLAQIPHGTARVEAERLSKINKDELDRVTAYCTAT